MEGHLRKVCDGLRYAMGKIRRRKLGARATQEKWRKIRQRAGELALNRGKSTKEPSNDDIRRAERELLGLQTLPNPDEPLTKKRL